MNVARLYFVFLVLLSACGTALSRAIPQEDEKALKRSKRSLSADHTITDKQSRNQEHLRRQLFIARLLKPIDTSGEEIAEVAVGSGLPATSTTTLQSQQDGSGSFRQHHKRRRGRGRKGKKSRKGRRRNRSHKKNRRNGRKRSSRSVSDAIVQLLESDQGENILKAIASTMEPDYQFSDDFEGLETFVQKSAKKCKCSKIRLVNQ